MSLTFFKNNKPDNRMVEYDQAIVRLGLEKAQFESEVKQKKDALKQINTAYDLVRSVFLRNYEKLTEEEKKEVGEKTSILFDYNKRIAEEKKKLGGLVLKQKNVVDSIKDKEKERELLLKSIEAHGDLNCELVKSSELLAEEKRQKERERDTISVLLQNVVKEKNKAVSDIYELDVRKSESERALEKANKNLSELNEIISILQASNKQGLDIVASFEGERKRLQDKEELLRCKESDLLVYENRVKKAAEKIGYNIKMIFK